MDAKRIISAVAVAAALLVGSQAQAAEDQSQAQTKAASVSVEVLSATTAAGPAVVRFSPEFELAFLDLYTAAESYEPPDLSCERGCVLEYNACMWDYEMSCEASLDECSATCE